MNSARFITFCVLAGTALAAGPTGAVGEGDGDERLVLVSDGAAHAAIVVAPDAPDPVRDVAERLRTCIRQMTGVELPLVAPGELNAGKGAGRRVAILVGPSAHADSPANELPTDPWEPGAQDGVVRVVDGAILLTGGPALESLGTRYAVGAFLRRFGAEGYRSVTKQDGDLPLYTHFPRVSELTVPARLNVRVRTHFLAREPGGTMPSPWSSAGGVPWAMAHNWKGILKEGEVDTHPEYFALVDGRRGSRPCLTHPVVMARFVETAAAALARGDEAFSLTPPDGTRWLCRCERCLGAAADPKLSADRFVALANTVRTKLDEHHPEFRNRKLHMLTGYGWAENRVPPGEGVAALPGVVLWVAHQGCHAHRWDDESCPINREWAEHFRGWAAVTSEPLGVYEYACYSNYRWDRKWASFPVVSVRRVVGDVAAYHGAGVGYLYYESEARWRRYVPFRWVDAFAANRAMADPSIDPDTLLRKLCNDLYGPAALTMFEYYDLLQTRLERTTHHAGNWYLPAPETVYSEADIERLTGMVAQAVWEAQASGGAVLERCIEAQKVWFEAVASLSDPQRGENGPKQFNEAPW